MASVRTNIVRAAYGARKRLARGRNAIPGVVPIRDFLTKKRIIKMRQVDDWLSFSDNVLSSAESRAKEGKFEYGPFDNHGYSELKFAILTELDLQGRNLPKRKRAEWKKMAKVTGSMTLEKLRKTLEAAKKLQHHGKEDYWTKLAKHNPTPLQRRVQSRLMGVPASRLVDMFTREELLAAGYNYFEIDRGMEKAKKSGSLYASESLGIVDARKEHLKDLIRAGAPLDRLLERFGEENLREAGYDPRQVSRAVKRSENLKKIKVK